MIRTFLKDSIIQLIFVFICIVSFHSNGIYAAGTMRDMTSMEIVFDMKVGWNLGNSLDAWADGKTGLATETTWGNPLTTKAMIDALKAKGFKTVRIPVTWNSHFGAAPAYAVDKAWMDRVEEVVNYVLDDEMYVILNSHHDEWVTLTASSQTEVTDKITKIWSQIATRFKDYSDYLIFETLNEPRLYGDTQHEWNGGTVEARKILNDYNFAIVNTIRNSGGNNALRHIMIPTHAATSMAVAQDALVVPNNDKRVIVSQHTYWPYNFTMNKGNGATSTWGSANDKSECDAELDRIQNKFVKKGIPVVIGEWGSIDKSNTMDRAVHAEYYAKAARKRGMLPVWWDNGYEKTDGFALLKRGTSTWLHSSIVDGLIKGVQDGTPVTQQKKENSKFNILEISSGSIRYILPKSANIALLLYDMQGRNVLKVIDTYQAVGSHEIKIPVTGISSGSYILELKSDNHSFLKTIFLAN
jgi:endoglucanase